jgi:hypothetical protein
MNNNLMPSIIKVNNTLFTILYKIKYDIPSIAILIAIIINKNKKSNKFVLSLSNNLINNSDIIINNKYITISFIFKYENTILNIVATLKLNINFHILVFLLANFRNKL